ncbi:DUF4336 domain-containing protein [Pseudahrensia aquimaris]|uniref:DUF4336 domain-containing protein n=1 Tax=Pseudahrensia aquimaris TaxID=744461 RepID=A0ABW3FC47_9HYPH
MLKHLGKEIWIFDGAPVEVLGFQYPTRMAIIRLANRELFVWSPIAASDSLMSECNALGQVTHIVAPNSLHHLSIPQWSSAYPQAKVYAPPRLRQKRTDILFDDDLCNSPMPAWMKEIDQVVFQGNRITDEVVFFHQQSGTVLFTDLLQQFPDEWFSGWRRLVAKFDKMIASEPSVPRKFQLAFTDRKAARVSLENILSWPAQTVVMAHGNPVTEDAQAFLQRAFGWLSD